MSTRTRTRMRAARMARASIALINVTLLVSIAQASNNFNSNYNNIKQPPPMQVFNGNSSSSTVAQSAASQALLHQNHFKILELVDEDTLLVGARNVVYNLSLTTLREQRRLEWAPDADDSALCRVKGKTAEQCQNYIRVIKRPSPSSLLVCGTNAFKPRCRYYSIGPNAYELTAEMPGEGACPYQENQNVTSLFTDGHLYSATAAHFNGIDGLIHRQPLRTEQYNPKQLNLPNFVSSFRYGEHVYFLFREVAIEHINCGKAIYSRIARVCINDSGGATTRSRERWTSFVKARLNCSIPGEFPFPFDEIQASTQVVSSSYAREQKASAAKSGGGGGGDRDQQQQKVFVNEDLIYAVFTTPTNSIGGSAVCAYRMADVLAAFDGPFKSQADSYSNWLAVPESRVPQQPRPGTCQNDSKRLPEEHINFIKDTPLMDDTVQPVWSQPLVTMASINFRFSQIVVDPQVETPQMLGGGGSGDDLPNMRTDVIFVGTDDGRVFKLINTYHLLAAQQQQQQQHLHRTSAGTPTAAAIVSHQKPPPLPSALAAQVSTASGTPLTPAQLRPTDLADVTASTIVIEELHLFDSRTPITGMLLARTPTSTTAASSQSHLPPPPSTKLIVMSSKQIKAIPLSRCERALSCLDCLSLYDPYCAWDLAQHACLSLGHSTVIHNANSKQPSNEEDGGAQPEVMSDQLDQMSSFAGHLQPPSPLSPQSPQGAWFLPNGMRQAPLANNHTLGWWSSPASCPSLGGDSPRQQQQVGAPYRSLFSSHLQVPSRTDYQSGHHLSRTSLVALPQVPTAAPTSSQAAAPAAASTQQRQPVSECLTFCGGGAGLGLYGGATSPLWSSSGSPGGSSGLSADALQQQQQQQQLMNCADYFANSGGGQLLWQQQQQAAGNLVNQNLYTSENLYLTVIICTLFGLILGLLFGFAIGKNTRNKNESSICSSTFDETNLYMASTGSHTGACLNGGAGNGGVGLFAPLTCHPNSTVARLTSHPAFLASQASAGSAGGGVTANNYASLASNGATNNHSHHRNHQNNARMNMFEASQSLLAAAAASDHSSGIGSSTYANNHAQHQQLLHFNQQQQQQQHERSPSIRTGALPPIPTSAGQQQQQPLVASQPSQTIHLQHSQLTPNSHSSSGSNSNSQPPTTSTSSGGSSITSQSTLQVGGDTQQQFYLNQQQVNGGGGAVPNNNLHQRSFTNSSSGSGGKATGQLAANGGAGNKTPAVANSTFLAQQQQQANNKIYL